MTTTAEKLWPKDALPFDTVLNGYRIIDILGRGGFGITYRAIDRIDQMFAIKEFFPQAYAQREGTATTRPADEEGRVIFDECLERFTREARALTLFSGQHLTGETAAGSNGVVRVITYFEANGTAYIVMEYVAGQGLDRLIAAHPEGLAEPELLRILHTLVPALGRVHEAGLLHRDIKPANISLRTNGDPVLLDFGAARAHEPGHGEAYTQIYTERYAPIEQVHGIRQGPYSDIYALGATCYHAIAGAAFTARCKASPIRHAALQTHQPDPMIPAAEVGAGRYSPRLLHAVDAALRILPEERPQDIATFARLLGLSDGPDNTDDETRIASRVPPAQPRTSDLSRATEPPRGPAGIDTSGTGAAKDGLPIVPMVAGVTVLALAAIGIFVWAKGGMLHQTPAAAAWQMPSAAPPEQAALSANAGRAEVPASSAGDAAIAAGRYGEALEAYRRDAAKGDAHAQYRLGSMYQNGQGVAVDNAAAMAWYRKAAAQNNAAAQSQLGYFYLAGLAGMRDDAEALSWYQRAAAQNFAVAEYQLGYMAQHGRGMARDFPTMLHWYQRAADQGSAEAEQQLGYCYQMGLGVNTDPKEAFRWYGLAAERHLASAMYSLGQMYFSGIGTAPDAAAGRAWIMRAASAGSSDAREWLAGH